MAERGTSFWQPPDFDPKKHKSINAYHGVHALRERARKIHQGIIIIRFEMPFNIWCNGCNNHIGMGVRYNAEKTKTGKYYSTTIYKFRMKCHLCDNHFEIQTDPKNLDYEILSGARRQERRWDPTKNEQVVPEDKATSSKLAADPMYNLEHQAEDIQKRDEMRPIIEHIQGINSRMKDDFACNQLLRKQFRTKKKELKEIESNDHELLKKASLNIKLVPENDKDVRMAKLLKLQSVESSEEIKRRKRKDILNQSVFKQATVIGTFGRKNMASISKKPQLEQLVKSLNSGSSKSRNTSFGKDKRLLTEGLKIKAKNQ